MNKKQSMSHPYDRRPAGIRAMVLGLILAVFLSRSSNTWAAGGETPLRVETFVVDTSPSVASPLAHHRCDAVGMPLTAREIVLVDGGGPIVLCAVDWIGISNGGYEDGPGASKVAQEVEDVLMSAMKELLQ